MFIWFFFFPFPLFWMGVSCESQVLRWPHLSLGWWDGVFWVCGSRVLFVFLVFQGCEEDHRASASQLRRGSQPVSGQGTRGQADATRPLLTAHHSRPPFMSSVVFSNICFKLAEGHILSNVGECERWGVFCKLDSRRRRFDQSEAWSFPGKDHAEGGVWVTIRWSLRRFRSFDYN